MTAEGGACRGEEPEHEGSSGEVHADQKLTRSDLEGSARLGWP
jgi:hypothetical protein